MNAQLKEFVILLLHPFRKPITWACQRGYLTPRVKNFLPWRWGIQPFTIYGFGWKCRWFPTAFDIVGQDIFWRGWRRWEKETAPVIVENIRNSRCFIDVGANSGIYTIVGCITNPNVRVVAIEPVPDVCGALKNNVAQNQFSSRVTALNIALGDSNKTVSFHQAENPAMSSLATEGYQGQRGKVIQVECRTLDSVVEELKLEPDFLKIDVEGFEDIVLSGASMVLSKFRPRIVLEANIGDPGNRMTEILTRHGYGFQILTENGPERRSEIIPDVAYKDWLCLPVESNTAAA
jgi:FkbM family methyltransferase